MGKFSNRFDRKCDIKQERRVIYIFTEGEKTEPNYFESIKENLRLSNVDIKIEGTGMNTLSLVNYVIGLNILSTNGDETWVVFDKDSFDRDFDNAIARAEANGIKVAYSNEAFELWYWLHFNYVESALGRDVYCSKLDNCIKKLKKDPNAKYKKNSKEMYFLIKHLESIAIKNSDRLLKSYGNETSSLKKFPSTTVHLLVSNLNKLAKENLR